VRAIELIAAGGDSRSSTGTAPITSGWRDSTPIPPPAYLRIPSLGRCMDKVGEGWLMARRFCWRRRKSPAKE